MEKRRIQLVGRSTLMVSLPIKWIKDTGLNKGDFVAIMGQNGAGKTTLIRTLNGLLRPTNGTVFLDGQDISNKTIANLSQKVGIIFQNPMHQLFSNTVEEEINFSLKSLDISKEEIKSRINTILKQFDFIRYRERSPFNLSGGESKKLAIASIVCRNPDILVFDEPTLGQDEKEINFIINLLNSEITKGKTIIIVTHNIEFTMEYIPRTVLMRGGQIVADGPTEYVLTNQNLIKNTSMVLPYIQQFKIALQQVGINIPDEIFKKQDVIEYLSEYLKNYSLDVKEGSN